MAKKNGLTTKQQMFVKEYLVDLNATQAAIRAGYSKKTARQIGEENLSKPDIAAAVQQAMNERSERVEVTADTVLRELLRIATADVSRAFDEEGRLLPLHQIPEETRRCIAGVEIQERVLRSDGTEDDGEDEESAEQVMTLRTKKVKFWDKPKCLELLGKHLKLYTDKLEVAKTPHEEALEQLGV